VPHPTTLSKLVRRCGPQVIAQLNAALLAKLADDKLLRCRKLRIDTTVVAANVAYPTDVGLLARAIGKLVTTSKRVQAAGVRPGPGSGTAGAQPAAARGRSPRRCGRAAVTPNGWCSP
jgi:transposase, IS5 family